MTWRDKFRPVIRDILAQISDGRAQDAELLAKYRELIGPTNTVTWPYKIWRDEIAKQRGLKTPKRKVRTKTAAEVEQWMKDHQIPLFEKRRIL